MDVTADPWLLVADYDGTTARLRTFPLTGVGETVTEALALATLTTRAVALGYGGTLAGTVLEALVWRDVLSADDLAELRAYVLARYGIAGT